MMIKEKNLRDNEKLNKALGESIDEIGDATKKSSRKIFDVLVEQGVQTLSDIFDKYKIIAKQKVTGDGKKDDKRPE